MIKEIKYSLPYFWAPYILTGKWKNKIEITYGDTKNYQAVYKHDPNTVYNYILYTKLINSLPFNVQYEIYKHQGDKAKANEALINGSIYNNLRIKIDGTKYSNKVLDVSNIFTGKVLYPYEIEKNPFNGIRTISNPGPRSRKIGIEGIPIVSDNIENYEKVMKWIYPDYKKYIEIYREIRDERNR